jgi:hypothetical protein
MGSYSAFHKGSKALEEDYERVDIRDFTCKKNK